MEHDNKPKKTNEVEEYLNSVWHDKSERPCKDDGTKGYIEILILRPNGQPFLNIYYVDRDWNDHAEDVNIHKWAYMKDFIPNIPSLYDYTTIKTYNDACLALGEQIDEEAMTSAGAPKHIIALMKLELVCKALWGGEVKVYPDTQGSRTYYYPWFSLYTQSEIQEMSEERRGLLLSANAGNGANAGWGYAPKTYRGAYSSARRGFRLCLDTYEKAEYFGTQFLELWAEYLAFNFTVGERLK